MAGDQKRFQTAMLHGDRLSEQGKWLDAMKAYRFALAEFPNNAAAVIGFGKAALASNQLDLARKAFMQALKINPTNLEALNYTGDVQERVGELDAAAETYLRMGNVYASRNDLNTAIDFWLRATKLSSDNTGAHRKLAEAMAQQGKVRLAAREFIILAAIYQRQGDQAQARQQIGQAQELLPNDPGVATALAAFEKGEKIQPDMISDTAPEPEPDEFVSEFSGEDPFGLDDLFAAGSDEQVSQPQSAGGLVETMRQRSLEGLANLIFEDSDDPNTMLIMQAVDQQSRDELAEAIASYRQAVDSGSDLPAVYFNLGLLYRKQGQLSEAADYLELASQDETYYAPANFVLGETYYATNDNKRAVEHFIGALKAIDLDTVSGQRYYELGQTYETLAENFLARSDRDKIALFVTSLQNFFSGPDWEQKVYEARMRMNSLSEEEGTMSLAEFLETPETEVMVTTLAATSDYMRRNFLQTASEECLRAIQKVPSFLPLHARLAEIMLKQNRTDEAITKYLYISKVYQMRNQMDQAVGVYQKILKLAPMDVTVRSKLIDMYTSSGSIDDALEQYMVLADSYYQLAQVDRALEKYNEAIRLSAQSGNGNKWQVEALSHMADIYNQRFDWSRATASLEQIRKLRPNEQRILRQLIELYFKQGKTNEGIATLDDLLAIYQRQNPLVALEFVQDLAASYPDNLALKQRLAVTYVQNNRIREAIREYDSLGEMQLERGMRDQAVQTIQAIINLGPDDVQGYRRLLSKISGGAI